MATAIDEHLCAFLLDTIGRVQWSFVHSICGSSAPLFPLHSHGREADTTAQGKMGINIIRRRDFLLRSQCSPDRACGKFVFLFFSRKQKMTIRDSLVILLSFSVLLLTAVADNNKNGDKRVGFKKNVNIARQWSCKNPQPRLVYIGTRTAHNSNWELT